MRRAARDEDDAMVRLVPSSCSTVMIRGESLDALRDRPVAGPVAKSCSAVSSSRVMREWPALLELERLGLVCAERVMDGVCGTRREAGEQVSGERGLRAGRVREV